MSESCPNCGSAVTMRDYWPDGSHETVKYGCETKACGLIRSLRGDLAEARAAYESIAFNEHRSNG